MQSRKLTAITAALALGTGLVATAPANAQQAEEEVEVRVETPEAPGAALPPPPPPPPPPPDVDYTPPPPFAPRLRLGGSIVGGGSWEGPDIGLLGAQVRAGIQIGDWLSLYYMPTGMVGWFLERPDTGDSDMAGVLWNSLLLETTIMHFLQLGIGPSVDFVWGCEPGQLEEAQCAEEDANFGLHGRVALAVGGIFGATGDASRRGIVLSLDVHPTWYGDGDEGIAMLGGLGFEMY